jgi:hypothetical protein
MPTALDNGQRSPRRLVARSCAACSRRFAVADPSHEEPRFRSAEVFLAATEHGGEEPRLSP